MLDDLSKGNFALPSKRDLNRESNFNLINELNCDLQFDDLCLALAVNWVGNVMDQLISGYCVRGFQESETVNWCMVVWCLQNVRPDGFSFTWQQTCQ